MKVVYGSTTLCDGVDYDGTVGKFIGPLGNNTVRTTWDQSPRKYIGAAQATPFNLGNALGEIPLRVGVEFSTIAAAQIFAYTHAQSLPQTGTLTMTGDDSDTETFGLASIVECSIEQTGCACLIDYKFQTGVLDEEEPA
jgi:hypothetical protein